MSLTFEGKGDMTAVNTTKPFFFFFLALSFLRPSNMRTVLILMQLETENNKASFMTRLLK